MRKLDRFVRRTRYACLLSMLALSPAAFAQTTTPTESKDVSAEQPVQLNAFHVSGSSASVYGADAANGAGRIALPIMDTPMSISVISEKFMQDIGVTNLLDAARYAASTSEGQFANRLDRITMRGFQQDPAQQSQFIDGFRHSEISAQDNMDTANVERIEIIKGPNAILAAASSPGGSLNFVTKAPKFTAGGYFKVQAGEYSANRAEVDTYGPLPWKDGKTLAYRLVAVYVDNKGYLGEEYDHHYFVSPSLTWNMSDATTLTVKAQIKHSATSQNGVPIDPRVGPNDPIVYYPGLRATSAFEGPESQGGQRVSRQYIQAEIVHKFSEKLQARIGEYAANAHLTSDMGSMGGITNQTGNIDPNTGLYTPGTTWTVTNFGLPAQAVTSTPAAFPNFSNRNGTYSLSRSFNNDLSSCFQSDVVYKTELMNDVKSTSVIGWAGTTHTYVNHSFAGPTVPLVGTIDNPDFAASWANATAVPASGEVNITELETTKMGYVSEIVQAFQDRLILSANVAEFSYHQRMSVPNTVSPASYASLKGSRTTKNGGLVFKPVKGVSVWGGYSENVNPPTLNSLGGTGRFDNHGTQYEGGVKAALQDGKINFGATYFSIAQHNVFVYDSVAGLYLPLGDVTSKGYEFEGNAQLSSNLTAIGSFASYKARDAFNRLLRSVPDNSGALGVRYAFNSGPLKGVWAMPNLNYLSRRAGDNPGTISIASAAPGTVLGTVNGRALNGAPVQPTFYLPARTIVGLSAGYKFARHYDFYLRVENLFNKKYVQVALNRGTVQAARPLNIMGSLQYNF